MILLYINTWELDTITRIIFWYLFSTFPTLRIGVLTVGVSSNDHLTGPHTILMLFFVE